MYRTQTTIIDLINSNAFQYYPDLLHPSQHFPITPKFVTLTYKEEITDLTQALKDFSKFQKRFSYTFYGTQTRPQKYLAVYEIQRKRAKKYGKEIWHFHCVYFNLPWIDKHLMQDCWTHGFIDVRDVSAVGNIGFYMTKYMLKDANDPKTTGHRLYLTSSGLKKPTVIRYEAVINSLIHSFPADIITSETPPKETKYLGELTRTRFNIAKNPALARQFQADLRTLPINE